MGCGISTLLVILLFLLKVSGVWSISWFIVVLPWIVTLSIILIVLLFIGILALIIEWL